MLVLIALALAWKLLQKFSLKFSSFKWTTPDAHDFLENIYFLKYKGPLINITNLLKTKTLKFGISIKLKMKSAFCIHNIKASDFA